MSGKKDQPEIKYTKIFINNEWIDSGKYMYSHL
jgi:hypothetical protein